MVGVDEGYHYYLNKPARIDNVFGAHRFEELLLKPEEQIVETLNNLEISHLVVNHRFFLVDENADHWGEQATLKLNQRFNQLITSKKILPRYQHRSVIVYEVSAE